MLINLLPLSEADNRVMSWTAPVTLTSVRISGRSYPIRGKKPLELTVTSKKDAKYVIHGTALVEAVIPCDRCLTPVDTEISLDFEKTVHIGRDEADDDEKNYLEGYSLDTDELLCNEILIGWPMKTLCKENCLGICGRCGANLNLGPCGCGDENPDPRMAAIQDIFRKYKEV